MHDWSSKWYDRGTLDWGLLDAKARPISLGESREIPREMLATRFPALESKCVAVWENVGVPVQHP
jgi:hypothetical protein